MTESKKWTLHCKNITWRGDWKVFGQIELAGDVYDFKYVEETDPEVIYSSLDIYLDGIVQDQSSYVMRTLDEDNIKTLIQDILWGITERVNNYRRVEIHREEVQPHAYELESEDVAS